MMQTVGRLDYFTSLPSDALHSFIKTTVSALGDFKFIPAESSEDPNYHKWQTLRLDLYGLVALWQAAPRPEAALLDVIKTAVQHSSTAALQALESVIKVLPADSMQDLLTYTLHERIAQGLAGCRSARRCLKILVRSEAAASVSDHTIAQLLLQAMQSRDGEFVQVLCDGLHQVYDVVGTVGEELLLQAVLQRDSKTVRAINDANSVVGCPVGLAFAAAVRTGQHSVLMDLDYKVSCRRSDIDRAFVLAVQSHKQRVFSEFLESYHLDPEKDRCLHELFLPALSAAVQFDNLKALERLCNLSYAYNLGAEFISNFDAVVHLAIVLGKQQALDILCRTVWGGQISNDSKACVFDAARNKGFDRVGPIRILCLGQRHLPSMGLLGRLENAKRSWRALGLRAYDLEKGLSDLDPFFLSSMVQVLAASTPAAAAATGKSAGQHPTDKPDVLSLPGIQQLKPESVSRLLLAAVQLRAVTVVQQLCTLPAAADICVEDAAYLLEQAIDLHYSQCPSYSCRDLQGRVMHCISKLPCVQSLQHSWLVGSIHAAVQHNGDVAVDLITQLPAAQDFSVKTVLQLLHTALVQGTAHIFSRLCSLPGARGLTLSNLVTLLRAGMADYHRAAHVKPLTDLLHSLPLAKQYWRSKDTIESLLDTAAHELDDRQQVMEVMRCLLNVPDLAHMPLDKQRFKMIRALNVESFLELHELKTVHCIVQKVVD